MEKMEVDGKDNNSLLLLGLELLKNLNKSNKVPYAVVKPRMTEEPQVPLKEVPQSPVSGNDRKRKLSGGTGEAEKKEKRRKMNRVAAQNARDRRKEHMESIEQKLALLEKQNKLLAMENKKLKEQTSSLEAEKVTLQAKLRDSKQDESLNGQMDGVLECSGSAVSAVSLQKKHTPMTPAIQTYLTVSLISWIYSIKTWDSSPQLTAQNLLNSFTHFQCLQEQKGVSPIPCQPLMDTVWGPHNPGWSPPL